MREPYAQVFFRAWGWRSLVTVEYTARGRRTTVPATREDPARVICCASRGCLGPQQSSSRERVVVRSKRPWEAQNCSIPSHCSRFLTPRRTLRGKPVRFPSKTVVGSVAGTRCAGNFSRSRVLSPNSPPQTRGQQNLAVSQTSLFARPQPGRSYGLLSRGGVWRVLAELDVYVVAGG